MILGPFFLFSLLLAFLYLFRKSFFRKNDFAPLVAHELKSSLTSLSGFSEILLTENLTKEKQKLALTQIQTATVKMNTVIESILALEKKLLLKSVNPNLFLEKNILLINSIWIYYPNISSLM